MQTHKSPFNAMKGSPRTVARYHTRIIGFSPIVLPLLIRDLGYWFGTDFLRNRHITSPLSLGVSLEPLTLHLILLDARQQRGDSTHRVHERCVHRIKRKICFSPCIPVDSGKPTTTILNTQTNVTSYVVFGNARFCLPPSDRYVCAIG
jgi:hypothetical protein